jgi:transcriptional regulator with XRE-family HTH domain
MTMLSERIKTAMGDAGFSQADLAAACNVKPPSVNDWLSGKTKSLKAATAHRAADFLGVNFLWLTEGTGPMRSYAPPKGDAVNFSFAPVPQIPRAVDPAIAAVVALMEATDATGREIALNHVQVALSAYRPQRKQAK